MRRSCFAALYCFVIQIYTHQLNPQHRTWGTWRYCTKANTDHALSAIRYKERVNRVYFDEIMHSLSTSRQVKHTPNALLRLRGAHDDAAPADDNQNYAGNTLQSLIAFCRKNKIPLPTDHISACLVRPPPGTFTHHPSSILPPSIMQGSGTPQRPWRTRRTVSRTCSTTVHAPSLNLALSSPPSLPPSHPHPLFPVRHNPVRPFPRTPFL